MYVSKEHTFTHIMATRKTTLEIDDGKLQRAAELLGTTTLKETIDRSFDAVIAAAARQWLIDYFSQPNDLEEPEVMRQAWGE